MLTIINDLPSNVVGVKATGKVDKEDFDKVLIPALKELAGRTGKINYLLHLDTEVKNFTLGAWLRDAKIGLKNFFRWNKIAIVTDEKPVENFSDAFGLAVPGESKGFSVKELEEAKKWVSS